MKSLEISYKMNEFSRKSDEYWGSCACFSELLKTITELLNCCAELLNCCTELLNCCAELLNCCAELLNCCAELLNCCAELLIFYWKILFSYFCLKLPKKLLSRQNNIFPPKKYFPAKTYFSSFFQKRNSRMCAIFVKNNIEK